MSAASSVGPRARAQARSMMFSSSRTLPGQWKSISLRSASGEMPLMSFPDSLAKRARKRFDQVGDVFLVLAQRRDVDGHDVQAVVEILAEGALFEGGAQIAIGGGDEAHVHFQWCACRRGARIRAPAGRAGA